MSEQTPVDDAWVAVEELLDTLMEVGISFREAGERIINAFYPALKALEREAAAQGMTMEEYMGWDLTLKP